MKRRGIAVILCVTMLFGMCAFAGCAGEAVRGAAAEDNLTGDLVPADALEVTPKDLSVPVTDFAVRLFKQSVMAAEEGTNVLVSPTSVLMALAMTANGAKGETLAQMEEVFGVSVSEELNDYLYSYRTGLAESEKYKLSMANSVWFRKDEDLKVKEPFLQKLVDYYGASAYQAPFDAATLETINAWVKEHTDGMIPKILDEIPEEAMLYLINAVSFDAEWQEIYRENNIHDDVFTKENGEEQEATFLYSSESKYVEDEQTTGFLKYYKDRKYAFVALLPKEGVTVADYVETLTGAHLAELLELLGSLQMTRVNAVLPKFEAEFDIELSACLKQMGMKTAFDGLRADFSDMASIKDDNLSIGRVLHKTFISVDEKGTKAGAATAVEMTKLTSVGSPSVEKTVRLDRPFVYMLIDCEANVPFFIGTMMDVE